MADNYLKTLREGLKEMANGYITDYKKYKGIIMHHLPVVAVIVLLSPLSVDESASAITVK